MIREIVTIDEELCDGCGLCVPACHEGAIQIIDSKARLVSDRMCDGLGDCLGHCPRGAITIERREADAFDEAAVAAQASGAALPVTAAAAEPETLACGCPGSQMAVFDRPDREPTGACPAAAPSAGQQSELTHWPVQLRLLPPSAPVLAGARLLVAADCVPVAYADFHAELLRERVAVIGCPKFDDLPSYVERVEAMIRQNDLKDITVARMEVPCCGGILKAVLEARRRAAGDVTITDLLISTRGEVLERREL